MKPEFFDGHDQPVLAPATVMLSGEPTIPRPHLAKQVTDAAAQRRLVLIQAPACYGKTSLMLQAHARLQSEGQRTIWVSLSGPVQAEFGLLQPLAGALGLDWRVCADAAALEHSIVETLQDGPHPRSLFIDGLEAVADAGSERVLRRLLRQLAPAVGIVLASRRTHAASLAHLRVTRPVEEIGPEALAFSKDEAALLLQDVCRGDEALLAHDQARGWVGALRLILAGGGRLGAAAQRTLDAFFRHEVLAPASSDLQRILLRTAPLERFTPELANELTETRHCAALIQEAIAEGCFIEPEGLDSPWVRYHPLFAGFLRRELESRDAGQASQLLHRAATWHARADHHVDAMRCTLAAGDGAATAALLEQRSFDLVAAGQVHDLSDLLAQVPPETVARSNEMSLAQCWVLTTHWRFAEAASMLDQVRQRLAEAKPSAPKARQRHAVQAQRLRHQTAMLSLLRDDLAVLEGPCRALLQEKDNLPPFVGGAAAATLGLFLREHFKFAEIWRLDVLAREFFERCPDPRYGLIWLACTSGSTRFAFGDALGAITVLEEAVGFARASGAAPGLRAMPAMLLASVRYARNEIEAATALIDEHLRHVGKFGLVDPLIAGLVTATQLARLRHDEGLRKRIHFMSVELAFVHDFKRLHVALLADQVRLLLAQGAARDAMRLARGQAIPMDMEAVMPGAGVTTKEESIAEIWVRLESEHRRGAEALAVATAWRNFVVNARAARAAIRWEILLAQVYMKQGEERQAARALRRATALAAPGGLVREFLDAPAVIHTVLVAQFGPGPTDASPASRLGRQVVALLQDRGGNGAAPQPDPAGLSTPLTPQEHQILVLTADGLKNAEIARRLGTTEGTVKAYLQRVFEKLGARGRTLAVARARSLGVIG